MQSYRYAMTHTHEYAHTCMQSPANAYTQMVANVRVHMRVHTHSRTHTYIPTGMHADMNCARFVWTRTDIHT